jgi:hypothetical protein
MVADPELNHVPTMTGGVGLDEVKRSYKYHMVPVNPPDMAISLLDHHSFVLIFCREFATKLSMAHEDAPIAQGPLRIS